MFTKIVEQVQANPSEYVPHIVARNLLQLVELGENKPTPVIEIARGLGFRVRLIDELPNQDSGRIEVHPRLKAEFGSTKCIFISRKIKPGKARFVIAYEIGHYLFDFNEKEAAQFSHAYTLSYNKDTQNRIEERRVNAFASELVMPRIRFIQEVEKLRRENVTSLADIIYELSEIFHTTIKTIENRFQDLKEQRAFEKVG